MAMLASDQSGLDDDDDRRQDGSDATSLADRRRQLHLQSEQKRRDSIKLGYDRLSELVGQGSAALSKATILQRSIRHMESLNRQREIQQAELDCLKKQVMAMQVIEASYRQLLASGRLAESLSAAEESGAARVPDSVKLDVFRAVMDALFESFDSATGSAISFADLSARCVAWLEEAGRPQVMHQLCEQVLQRVLTQRMGTNSIVGGCY